MTVEFDKSFEKAIDKIKDEVLLSKIEHWILKLEEAKQFQNLSGIKKLQGFKTYYRIRIGEYRLGIEHIDKDTVRFITVAHRKDIYKRFP